MTSDGRGGPGDGGRRRAGAEVEVVNPEHRLVTYGTLAPGRANHHQVEGLRGRWVEGHVHGHLHPAGWGATLGFPALVLDADGPAVRVSVLESADLGAHWERLDAFEGPGYRRVLVTVHTDDGDLEGQLYALDEAADGTAAATQPPPA